MSMIERVFNEELNQFVYRIEKKQFSNGLDKTVVDCVWNQLCPELSTSVDFEEYPKASAFAKKLANMYFLYSI